MPKKKPTAIPKQKIFNIAVVVVLAILAFFTYINFTYTNGRLDWQAEWWHGQQQDTIYQHRMLEFCYERTIHPCDWTALEEWNAGNPDDTFATRTPSQLRNKLNPPLAY